MAEYEIDDYLRTAQALAARVAAQADRIERERRIPEDLAGELADAGLFRLLVPRSLGGGELAPPDFIRIIEVFAGADASTAWCLSQNNVFATSSVIMPEVTAREIWSDPRAVVSNGPPVASARAVPVEGGYRLSGRWNFSSGSPQATWVAALTPIVTAGAETGNAPSSPPLLKVLLLPKGEVSFLDLWEVRGLRGTGSFSFEVADLFVPEARVYHQGDPCRESGLLYTIPRTLLFGMGNATVALGVARASLNTVIRMIGSPTGPGVVNPQQQSAVTHRTIGEAEAQWRSARALLRQSAQEIWDVACATGNPPKADRVHLRLAITHAIRTSVQLVETAYSMCGSSSIFEGNTMQRLFQDMHVIGQHIQGRATHYETAGQLALGLEPVGRF